MTKTELQELDNKELKKLVVNQEIKDFLKQYGGKSWVYLSTDMLRKGLCEYFNKTNNIEISDSSITELKQDIINIREKTKLLYLRSDKDNIDLEYEIILESLEKINNILK